ncbi:UDP-N-acetylmuramoyl-L-alanyl-D-glutamate--2,6-diaminopimelate ligase [Planktothrix sp. FACHB-1355]|uniref:UDP-N-acetylmuramoyl-L-alanyl-D-glutamate--2,6-diaminopimelate ligase n=1 Tax=Aerosakkonema funiforme FACHB-1375 TaxID=2949571 RepID=A0A926VCX4_9CYAN|nr:MULTISPECIES: UDP-N-acetylmuramoyl-L-alanyl-D-glutamate--2,6-diaminopimelate ligase [Oscillatoriales]MBD2181405.1 UDP-N-acetylmuramoyl-L-alanyl-D-glutamate--2,6-diaminopimelate ligase [Aerosakkonema funiforme FACHB-1375]MBD3558265.1 UDP-N-acetylmuramoyl-L-alanyl-D-glutamate--2,6-diaminopimelate ligase [Planktothrix sp. FACHB-1355]
MKLREILAKVSNIVELPHESALDVEVTGLTTNSHACKPGDLFIGMPGTRVDGGDFWPSAIASGAVAALVSAHAAQKGAGERGSGGAGEKPLVIPANDMVKACAEVALAFYGYPGQQLELIGVTGTNGKTTTTHLIEFFLNQAKQATGLIGTLYARWPGFEQTATHTTPFSVELQHQLAQAVAAGCQKLVMEVSSHALAQGRVMGCPFEVAVFTNLTQDHLDFHKDMEDYFSAKALLFNSDYLKGRAIVNLDDPYGERLISQLNRDRVWSYSVNNSKADLWTSDLSYEPTGVSGKLHTPKGEVAFRSPLVGQYNLANLLAAVGTVLHLGFDLSAIVDKIPEFPGVPGRMERVQINPNQDISAIVDYAHTPDSLENLLKAARPFIPGQMICVFGCGGDRDRTKRPKMGGIAAQLADKVVVTSDNPRTEDAQKILQDILAGIPESVNPTVICDRAVAIRTAILEAQPGDGVLIAGKGHEDYQILGTEKIHFDDREQARSALSERLSATV